MWYYLYKLTLYIVMIKLTAKQQKFIDEYLIDLNATQAAARAGYSQKTAQQVGSRLLLNVVIQQQITIAQSSRQERTHVTQDRVLLEIARLAFNDPRRAFKDNGDIKDIKDWPDDVAAAISSIKITEQTTNDGQVINLKEIKFWDKGKQIELAGRHLSMFTDKVKSEVSGPGGGAITHQLAPMLTPEEWVKAFGGQS
jgi:phage terminase small subunit